VEIQFTGLREGEKLTEELFYGYEKVIPTSCEKIKRTSGASRNWAGLCPQLGELPASMSIDGAAPSSRRYGLKDNGIRAVRLFGLYSFQKLRALSDGIVVRVNHLELDAELLRSFSADCACSI
jgi:hypothetical protein